MLILLHSAVSHRFVVLSVTEAESAVGMMVALDMF